MAYLDYDDLALAEHDRAECEAAARQAAMDVLTDRVQVEIERDVRAVLESGDLSAGKVIAGEVFSISGRKCREVQQDAIDMFMDACLDNVCNLKLLSELIASPAGQRLRDEIAETHAAINAQFVAEARGLA